MTLIQAQLEDRVGTLAFDHYAKRNALGADLIAEMLSNLDDFARQKVGAVVIRSASDQSVWSSGHDVAELPLADLDPIPYDEPLERLLRAVKRFPAPVIAMVHGSVWGGAFDLVQHEWLPELHGPRSAWDREGDVLHRGSGLGGTGPARGVRQRSDLRGRVGGVHLRDGADDRVPFRGSGRGRQAGDTGTE
jgi:hypothetical protein